MSTSFLSNPQGALQGLLERRRQETNDEVLIKNHVRANMAKAVEEQQEKLQGLYDTISEVLSSDGFLNAKIQAASEGLSEEFFKEMGSDVNKEIDRLEPTDVVASGDSDFPMVVLRRMAHDLLSLPMRMRPHHAYDPQEHYENAWEKSKRLGSLASTWKGLFHGSTLEIDIEVLKSLVGAASGSESKWVDSSIKRLEAQISTTGQRVPRDEKNVLNSLHHAFVKSHEVLLSLDSQGLVPSFENAVKELRKGNRSPKARRSSP